MGKTKIPFYEHLSPAGTLKEINLLTPQNLESLKKPGRTCKEIIVSIKIMKIHMINKKNSIKDKLAKELKKSEQQIRDGKFYTQEEVMKEFGLS